MMYAVESGQVSPALGIPMYYIQAAPLVSFILVAFRIIQRYSLRAFLSDVVIGVLSSNMTSFVTCSPRREK